MDNDNGTLGRAIIAAVSAKSAGMASKELLRAYDGLKELIATHHGRGSTLYLLLDVFEKNGSRDFYPLIKVQSAEVEQIAQIMQSAEQILALVTSKPPEPPESASEIQFKDAKVGIVGDHATIHGDVNINGNGSNPKTQLHTYLKDLALETDQLPWGAMAVDKAWPGAGESLNLSDVYTALDTTEPERLACEDDVRQCLRLGKDMKRIPAQRMINEQSRLVLLGDPGCGKTTLVNFITNSLARSWYERDGAQYLARLRESGGWQHGRLIPVRVVLREYGSWLATEGDDKRDLLAWLRKSFWEKGWEKLWEVIHQKLAAKKPHFLFLLDGLDEVPTAIRQRVVEDISAFGAIYTAQHLLVTCRIYAYVEERYQLRNFHRAILAPFSSEQINRFIDAWYHELAKHKQIPEGRGGEASQQLKRAVRESDLVDLAERPLILTVMALLHTSYGQLPDDRVKLYGWAVELLLSRWKSHSDGPGLNELLTGANVKMSNLEDGLYDVAFQVHATQGLGEGTADIAEELLLKILKPYLGGYDIAEKFVEYVRERSGLLIRHKTSAYTFPHRTFQEFMAACHLVGLKDYPAEAAKLVVENPDLYRIVFVLAAGHAARGGRLGHAVSSVSKLCPAEPSKVRQPGAPDCKRAVIAGEALLEISEKSAQRDPEGVGLFHRVRDWLLHALTADTLLKPPERADAGNVLARMGDPRFDPDKLYLPREKNFGFVRIPAGSFWMGSDEKRDPDTNVDEVRHRVHLSEYWISRYPVTVDQYRFFAESTGWELDDGWREYNRFANHPVIAVSWHDAVAYSQWLTEKFRKKGLTVSLPTEAQWERAAREDDERIYPWGDEKIDLNRANFESGGKGDLGTTSPVGCYPSGATSNGLMDMAGNVWEWCRDHGEWDGKKGVITNSYRPDIQDPIREIGSSRVMRGGSWFDLGVSCRAAYRDASPPGDRYRSLGFRLVLSGQK